MEPSRPCYDLSKILRPGLFFSWFFAALFLYPVVRPAQAAGGAPFITIESFAHAEPVPIKEYVNGWGAPLNKGSNAITHDWVETGLRFGAYSIAYIQRYDYEMEANRAAAEVYHAVRNKDALTPDYTYWVNVRAFHQRSQGLRFAYRHEMKSGWNVTGGLSLLQGMTLTDGFIQGNVTAASTKDYNYAADVQYFYTRDDLFKRPLMTEPDGSGLSLDLAIGWRPTPSWRLHAQVRDLYGYLDWRPAPYTVAKASSDIKEYDADGYARFSPTISGVEDQKNFRQKLRSRSLFQLDWMPVPHVEFGASLRVTQINSYVTFSARHKSASDVWVGGDFMPYWNAFGISVWWKQFMFSLMTDRFSVDNANLLTLNLGMALGSGT